VEAAHAAATLAYAWERSDNMRVPSQQEIQLVNTALYLRRPLLLTGDPGVGKSTLAYAVAHELGLGPVMRWPITTRSTLYHYDPIGRLREENLRRIRGEALPAEADDIGTQIRLRPSERHCWPYRRPRVLLHRRDRQERYRPT
jgi:hypothetical protein